MAKAVQLPYLREKAEKLGPKRWRKQILPVGEVEHPKHGTLSFGPALFEQVVAAFKAGDQDTVPFLLANEKNEHHDDPELVRGEVTDLEIEPDGLYGIVETTDRGTELLEEQPKLPVSVRVYPPGFLGRSRATLGHVLGTLDPMARGMKPWEALEASNDDVVLDLSADGFSFPTVSTEAQPSLSSDDQGVLARFVKALRSRGGKDAADDEMTDEETQAVIDGILKAETPPEPDEQPDAEPDEEPDAEPEATEPVAASLSDEDRGAVELANRNAESASLRAKNLETTLAAERWSRERDDLVRDGVPPVMLDLATPLMEDPSVGPIELSNSQTAEPQAIIRQMLQAAKGTVDLSERGASFADNGEAEVAREMAAKWAEQDKPKGAS